MFENVHEDEDAYYHCAMCIYLKYVENSQHQQIYWLIYTEWECCMSFIQNWWLKSVAKLFISIYSEWTYEWMRKYNVNNAKCNWRLWWILINFYFVALDALLKFSISSWVFVDKLGQSNTYLNKQNLPTFSLSPSALSCIYAISSLCWILNIIIENSERTKVTFYEADHNIA